MTSVGIIANPRAGKDIRRLVAHGSVLDTQEKVYIVRRAFWVSMAPALMKWCFCPIQSALASKRSQAFIEPLRIKPRFLEMPVYDEAADSTRAAALMHDQGVACVIVIGGDGTSRVVAKGSQKMPLIPLSTGTNNAFPRFLESTLAGLAAGYLRRATTDMGRFYHSDETI